MHTVQKWRRVRDNKGSIMQDIQTLSANTFCDWCKHNLLYLLTDPFILSVKYLSNENDQNVYILMVYKNVCGLFHKNPEIMSQYSVARGTDGVLTQGCDNRKMPLNLLFNRV